MEDKEFKGILHIITPAVVAELIKRRNLPQIDAVKKFYSSETYSLLEIENTKMWHFSYVALCDMVEQELNGNKLEVPVEL